MKTFKISNLFIAFLLCGLTFFSCTPQDSEVDPGPKKLSAAPVNIQHLVENLESVLAGTHALLLKPVDDDTATNLTTVYQLSVAGEISAVVDSFEVKQIETTPQGVYVLTNYDNTTFFVKFDNTWIELKDVGTFIGAASNGDVLFSDGSVLRVSNLSVDRSNMVIPGSVVATSGTLMLISDANGNKSVVDPVARVRNEVSPCSYDIISINDNHMSVTLCDRDYTVTDMKTGNIAGIEPGALYNPRECIPNLAGDGIIAVSELWQPKWDGVSEPGALVQSYVSFGYSTEYENMPIVTNVYQSEYNGEPLSDEPNGLDVLRNMLGKLDAYAVEGLFIYYSGTNKSGEPVTGIYNWNNGNNTLLSKDNFITIKLL